MTSQGQRLSFFVAGDARQNYRRERNRKVLQDIRGEVLWGGAKGRAEVKARVVTWWVLEQVQGVRERWAERRQRQREYRRASGQIQKAEMVSTKENGGAAGCSARESVSL